MQTLSNLRRSRINYQPLVLLLLLATAIVYESIGTIYPYLSPLLGVGFYYWLQNFTQKEKYLGLFFFFCYTVFVEIDRQLILFSFIILTLSYYFFIINNLEKYISCTICLIIFNVIYAYLGYFLLNLFFAFVFNLALPTFDMVYFIYIITDIFLILLFL